MSTHMSIHMSIQSAAPKPNGNLRTFVVTSEHGSIITPLLLELMSHVRRAMCRIGGRVLRTHPCWARCHVARHAEVESPHTCTCTRTYTCRCTCQYT